MRGIIGGAGFLLDYHCMSVLPLGDAMTLMSLYPFITIVLARIFLQEEIKALHLYATIASVSGAVFIGQPTFLFGGGTGDAPTLGYITGLLGSCCLASILILIRKAGKIGVHTFQLLLSWALFGVIFGVVIGPYEGVWKWPSSTLVWGYVLGVCLIGAGCHFMLNYAGRLAPAGLVSVVRASDILWAYCFEIIFFVQKPNFCTWIGVVLVLGSLVVIGIEKIKESKNNRQISSPTARKQSSKIVLGDDDANFNDSARNTESSIQDEELYKPRVSPRIDEESQGLITQSNKDE